MPTKIELLLSALLLIAIGLTCWQALIACRLEVERRKLQRVIAAKNRRLDEWRHAYDTVDDRFGSDNAVVQSIYSDMYEDITDNPITKDPQAGTDKRDEQNT